MPKYLSFVFCFFVAFSLIAEETHDKEIAVFLARGDAIPVEAITEPTDPYFEGYIQALVDMHYYEHRVIVIAKDGDIYLANLPTNKVLANSIISFVKEVPGVCNVKVLCGVPPKEKELREKYVNRPRIKGIWFPQSTLLFQPFIANPRVVAYSAGYRWKDDIIGQGHNVIPISLGDDFGIYRWLDVGPYHADVQFSVEACMWSVFRMGVSFPNSTEMSQLINTDYYIGFPLTYAVNKWAYQFRIYHISCHLGDELLVRDDSITRVNPSYEAIDLFVSYQANQALRVYGGPGFLLRTDTSYPMQHFYFEYGAEFRFWGTRMCTQRLYGNFVVAAHVRQWQMNNYDFDGTYVAGYEISKLQGIGRKVRLLGQFHNGFSLEGQFAHKRSTYGGIVFAYGF